MKVRPSAASYRDSAQRPGRGPAELNEAMLHVATLAVFAIPGTEGAAVTVFEPDRRPLWTAASIGFARAVDAIQHGLGEGPCLSARDQSATVRSGHLGEDPRWLRSGPEIVRHGVHSVLSLPLIHGPRVIAVVSVYAYARDAFQNRAVGLAELFAGPAAATVGSAMTLTQPDRSGGQGTRR